MNTYEELLAGRDALAAQVEALEKWRRLALQFDGQRMQAMGLLKMIATGHFDMRVIQKFVADAPVSGDAYLAEIKAEAGRAGFISGAEMWCDCGVESQYKADCLIGIEADADRYAIKIRNAGTWLKDSNVNGGKRQGGAE